MTPSQDVPAPHAPGVKLAWMGGGAVALGAAGLAFLFQGAPLAKGLWGLLPAAPVQAVAPLTAFGMAFGVGLGAAMVGMTVYPVRRVIGLLSAAGLLCLFQSLVLALHGLAWEPLPALIGLLGAGSLTVLLRPQFFGPATAFQGRVSAKTMARLARVADPAFLQPDQLDATVISCRLLNENALREVLPARDFLKLCQAFRTAAGQLLMEHGGCLDPREDSGVRAFFGLPLRDPEFADDAVKAALALDDGMRAFAEKHASPAGTPACGIGLATGKLTAGLVGGSYSVLGDAVELSRWLAAETANYEVRCLTDSATHLAADRVEDRPLEFVNPPDGAAVEIFHLLGTAGSLSQEAMARRHAFRDAIMLLRAGHAEDARQRFGDAREGLTVPDPVLEYFVTLAADQSQRDAASSGAAPPPSAPLLSDLIATLGHSQAEPGLSAAVPPATAPVRREGNTSRKLPRRP